VLVGLKYEAEKGRTGGLDISDLSPLKVMFAS